MCRWAILAVLLMAAAFAQDNDEDSIQDMSRQLVQDIREVTDQAKRGTTLKDLYDNVAAIHLAALEIVQQLSDVSESESNLVVNMAAAETGSHEFLLTLLADDHEQVLDGQIAMSLALLDKVADLFQDELALSDDVGPHLMAVAFACQAAEDVLVKADETVTSPQAADDSGELVRRQSDDSWGLGFGLDKDGLTTWKSHGGNKTVSFWPTSDDNRQWKGNKRAETMAKRQYNMVDKPDYRPRPGPRPHGKRQWSGNLGGSVDSSGNWKVSAGVTFKW